MKSVSLLSLLLLVLSLALALLDLNVKANPITPAEQEKSVYITPLTFCSSLPQGQYCNPSFPRGFISCPTGLQMYCLANEVCQPSHSSQPSQSGGMMSIECIENAASEESELCRGKEGDTAHCLSPQTIVECSKGEVFECAADMTCQKRGRRAYCIPPNMLQMSDSGNGGGVCDSTIGYSEGEIRVCHPLNLKKVVTCPSGKEEVCPQGEICDVPSFTSINSGNQMNGTLTGAVCVPYSQNMQRLCSNKPIHSSFCIPQSQQQSNSNGGDEMIMCSYTPQLLKCDQGKRCVQNGGISADCVGFDDVSVRGRSSMGDEYDC